MIAEMGFEVRGSRFEVRGSRFEERLIAIVADGGRNVCS
jgi:hypothetical protein